MKLHMTAVLLMTLAITAGAQGADKPSARCLPDETIAAMRIPHGKTFADHLIKQTKFGAALFTQDRWEKIEDLLAEESDFDLDEINDKLGEIGLDVQDFKGVFSGESGIAVLAAPREDRHPVMIGLLWIEPGEEEAGRFINAMMMGLEEGNANKNKQFPVDRRDIELGKYKVTHLVAPEVDHGGHDFDFDAEWENMDADADEQQPEDAEEEKDEAAANEARKVDQTHILIAQRKSKILVAFTVPQSREMILPLLDAKRKVDWDGITGAAAAKGVFARFLAAHDNAGGEMGPFAQRAMDAKGLHGAMPAGVPAFEVMVDFKALTGAVEQFDDHGEIAPVFKAMGMDQFGFAALRWSLDGNMMRGGAFLQAKAPRKGLLAALDQKPIKSQPPAWVPYDVLDYTHVSFDLGKFYKLIKQMVIEAGGQDAAQGFQMAEQQTQMMLQADVASVLSSLGHQHIILTYPPVANQQDAADEDQPFMPQMNQRTALVWQVTDEQLWQRIMQMIGGFAQMSNGALVFAEEQGFSGWRLNQPPVQGGLFLGQGHLVVAIGSGVVEAALAALSNPPDGDAALVNSDTFKRAGQIMDLKPGLAFNVSDMQRVMKYMRDNFSTSFTGMAQAGMMGDDAMQALKALMDIFPSEKEMQGMFGVVTSTTYVDENGMVSHSILELPPPDEK